jgi:hypothetical protein
MDSRFMSAKEKLANRHLIATANGTHGRTNVAAQEEARNSRIHLRNFLSGSGSPGDGVDAFVQGTAQRIMAPHSDELHVNPCPMRQGHERQGT